MSENVFETKIQKYQKWLCPNTKMSDNYTQKEQKCQESYPESDEISENNFAKIQKCQKIVTRK